MFNLIRQLLSPYLNMQKVDFRPLEYIEVEQGKPLIIKLNDKFIFKAELQIAENFIKFNTSKNIMFDNLDKLNKINDDSLEVNIAKVSCYNVLIKLLYEISKNNYDGFFKRRKYYKFLSKLFLKDIVLMINVFTKVLAYNSDLKKKLEDLRNIKIFSSDASELTAGGQPLQDLIEVDPSTGEKRFKH
ncbi:hypothetical protein LCGC14_2673030 [marine sediment metagenome]|uniref:Uncharacterized protein n=1 Tax=marine sediment metagenome TaxID=412755 RepID=A0A0F9AB19_9ZZZZ